MSQEPRAKTQSLIIFLLAAIVFPLATAQAAELTFRSGITVSEEYNDNLFLTPDDRVTDYVTRAMPSVNLHYGTDFWNWDVNYAYDYRHYARRNREDDETQSADARNRTELIKNILFLEMRDVYSRISLDVARDFTSESQFVNQTDRNVFTLNPYLMLKSDSPYSAVLGYRYIKTWYEDPLAIDTVADIGYAEVAAALSSRLTFTTGATFTHEESNARRFDRIDVYAGPHYTYAPNSYVYVSAANSRLDFGEGGHATHLLWKAGLTHQYSTMTASVEASLSFISDPLGVLRREDRYMGTVRKETARTSFSISGGMTEYRNAKTKNLESTTYRLGGTMRYTLTPRSSLSLDLSTARQKDYQTSTHQDLYFSGVRIEHRSAESLTLALDYRYTNVYSPDVYAANYFNNRITLEIRKVF